MCIEFQHLSRQVVVIKGLAYLLILLPLEDSENNSKLKDWINLAFSGKNYFRILGLGLGLDTSNLVNIPTCSNNNNLTMCLSEHKPCPRRQFQATNLEFNWWSHGQRSSSNVAKI